MSKVYLSPREEKAVIDAVTIMAEAVPENAEDADALREALPKLAPLFADYHALTNIAAIAHNAIVWNTGNRKRFWHKLADLAEALVKRDGEPEPGTPQTQLQIEAARIRGTWGWHVNE